MIAPKNKSMAFKNTICAISLLLISGCGFFSKKVESIVEKEELKNAPVVKPVKKNLYCGESGKLQLILEDEPTLKFYKPLLSSLFDNKSHSFVQKSAMLALIEMIRRPDVASPTSRFQFFLRIKGKDHYFDFSSRQKDNSMPYIKAIEFLMTNFDGAKNLDKLSEILDSNVPSSLNVTPELENFLQLYRNDISKNDELTEYFFKGDEVLTKHESFKRHSFKKTYKQYLSAKNNNESLYQVNQMQMKKLDAGTAALQLECNLDINQETPQSLNVQNKNSKSSHYFAIMEGDNFFIGASSSSLPGNKVTNLKGTYFINTSAPSTPLPVCEYKNQIQDIVLFSTKGRYPEQHLRHLITYDIALADSQELLKELLTFSRHLFLSNPDRILYESKRGRKAQLDFFLSMNFPIYHVSSLGDVIGAANFSGPAGTSKSLIVDDRSSARLRCSP